MTEVEQPGKSPEPPTGWRWRSFKKNIRVLNLRHDQLNKTARQELRKSRATYCNSMSVTAIALGIFAPVLKFEEALGKPLPFWEDTKLFFEYFQTAGGRACLMLVFVGALYRLQAIISLRLLEE